MSHDDARMLNGGARAFTGLPRRLIARVLLTISPSVEVDGFSVVALNGDIESQPVDRLREAIRLIRDFSPRVFKRLQRDVRRIMLVQAGGPEYWPFANGFILNTGFVKQSDTEFIALTVVHEGMHARLWHAGVPYEPGCRERIERVCVRAEMAFASRLPDPGYYVEHVQKKLETKWWTPGMVAARQARARDQLWPQWLVRAHRRVFPSGRGS